MCAFQFKSPEGLRFRNLSDLVYLVAELRLEWAMKAVGYDI